MFLAVAVALAVTAALLVPLLRVIIRVSCWINAFEKSLLLVKSRFLFLCKGCQLFIGLGQGVGELRQAAQRVAQLVANLAAFGIGERLLKPGDEYEGNAGR